MQPIKSFGNLLIILGGLLVVGCALPQDGIGILPNMTLTFPSPAQWFGFKQNTDIDHFTFSVKSGDFLNQHSGTSKAARSSLPSSRCTPADIRALPMQHIEFPSNSKNMLTPMWRALRTAHSSKATPVRILHYGDSQIEADRISGYLRRQLQLSFGGSGVGFLPFNPLIPVNPTVQITLSDGWVHSQSLVKNKQRTAGKLGHLLSASTIANGRNNAWITIRCRSLKSYPRLQFSQIRILLSNTVNAGLVEISAGGRGLYKQHILPRSAVQQIVADIGYLNEPITITFMGATNLTVYGLALDGQGGAVIDNIPLRASAGLDFVRIDPVNFKQCLDFLDVALIILQFGVNVVPHQNTDYKYYEEQIYRQLKHIQQAQPQTPILVMGVSDIAHRNAGGVLSSYPNVELVRNAQRRAAMRAGCAFWDTYQAMGGRNSIISWVYAQPPLATKDFCHFSPSGIDLIAELLWGAMAATMN
jgi:hypothetical protein